MTEINQDQAGIDRRTLVKGAAWSAPVIAAAVASPLAAATTEVGLSFGGDCILQAAGVSLGPGFELVNTGTTAWTGTITFQERFCVDSSIPLAGNGVVRGVIRPVWIVSNVLDFYSAGVTATSAWSWPLSGILNTPVRCATRTVMFSGTLAPGERAYWGRPLSLLGVLEIPVLGNILDLAVDLEHVAEITSINPAIPATGLGVGDVGSLNWQLLDGSC